MKARWLAALLAWAVTVACGGTEELALNPTSATSSGAAGDVTMTTSGAGGMLGTSGHGGSAGSPSEQEAGGSSRAGEGPVACSGDLQCRAPTPRCSENGSCVSCVSDDDCPLDGARRCNDEGRCVACRQSEDCGDNQTCDTLIGACQACSGAECDGAGGSSEGGKP